MCSSWVIHLTHVSHRIYIGCFHLARAFHLIPIIDVIYNSFQAEWSHIGTLHIYIVTRLIHFMYNLICAIHLTHANHLTCYSFYRCYSSHVCRSVHVQFILSRIFIKDDSSLRFYPLNQSVYHTNYPCYIYSYYLFSREFISCAIWDALLTRHMAIVLPAINFTRAIIHTNAIQFTFIIICKIDIIDDSSLACYPSH